MKCQYCTWIGWVSPSSLLTRAIVSGVAARPASSRATVLTGRAKNSRNAARLTTHRTTIPLSTRRIRKRVNAMAASRSRRAGGGGRGGPRGPAPPAPFVPDAEQPLGPRVHGVPDAVTQQVERQRG